LLRPRPVANRSVSTSRLGAPDPCPAPRSGVSTDRAGFGSVSRRAHPARRRAGSGLTSDVSDRPWRRIALPASRRARRRDRPRSALGDASYLQIGIASAPESVASRARPYSAIGAHESRCRRRSRRGGRSVIVGRCRTERRARTTRQNDGPRRSQSRSERHRCRVVPHASADGGASFRPQLLRDSDGRGCSRLAHLAPLRATCRQNSSTPLPTRCDDFLPTRGGAMGSAIKAMIDQPSLADADLLTTRFGW
jgi:hypothetical protein